MAALGASAILSSVSGRGAGAWVQNFQIYPKEKKLPLRSLRLGPWPGILSVWRTSAANSWRAAGGGGGIGRGGALLCSTREFAGNGGATPLARGLQCEKAGSHVKCGTQLLPWHRVFSAGGARVFSLIQLLGQGGRFWTFFGKLFSLGSSSHNSRTEFSL